MKLHTDSQCRFDRNLFKPNTTYDAEINGPEIKLTELATEEPPRNVRMVRRGGKLLLTGTGRITQADVEKAMVELGIP